MIKNIMLVCVVLALGACSSPFGNKKLKDRTHKIDGVTIKLSGEVIDPQELHRLVHPILVVWQLSAESSSNFKNKKHLNVTPHFAPICKDKGWTVTLKNGMEVYQGGKIDKIKFSQKPIRKATKITFQCEPTSYTLN